MHPSDPPFRRSFAGNFVTSILRHRLFQPDRSWQGRRALVPVDLCYRVFDLLALLTSLAGGTSAALLYATHPEIAVRSLGSWTIAVFVAPLAVAAVCRGLPFQVRFALYGTAILFYLTAGTIDGGLLPTFFLVVLMLLLPLSLFYGTRAGLAGVGAVTAILVASAWGWIQGYLPWEISVQQSSALLFDFRSPLVWVRNLSISIFGMTALLIVMHVILRRLRDSLDESKRSLQLLAGEQVHRARAEVERGQQQQLFRTLFEQANDAILLMGRQHFLSCNPRTEVMFGCRQEEIVGHSPAEFSPPCQPDGQDSTAKARELIEAAFGGVPQAFEWQHRRRDGSEFAAEVSLSRLEIGGELQLLAIVRDVTERKRAEFALQSSEERYRSLIHGMKDIVYSVSADGTVSFIGPQVRHYGFTVEEIVGRNFSALVIEDDRASVLEHFRRTITARQETQSTFRVLTKKGDIVWVEQTGRATRDSAGDVTAISGILRDVTKRVRAEEALRQRTRSIETILENAPIGLAIFSMKDGRKRYVNRQFEEIYGLPHGAVATVDEFYAQVYRDPAVRARERAVFEAILTSGHPPVKRWEGEAIQLPSGETRQIVATSVLLPEPDLVMATVQDVTERHQAEAERQHLQTQLIQAQKMEAIGQLAGGVAHDFNNILTAVLMQLSLLREEPQLPREVQAGLKDLEGEAKRAANLTRQLLMFSRRQTLQPQLLDLNSLLGNLLKMLRRLIGEHIHLEFAGAAGDLWLEADPGMLEQVVMNLVVNARDAMPAGGRVSLTTQLVNFDESASQRNPEARPGAFACLAITDTGCGMDEATIKHIFEPFFTTKEVGKGTGLGLATVYGIVKQHRGWVEVRSAVDHGSTFEVFLPASAQFTIKAVDEATVATLPRGDETLLVVEDEASVRRTMVTTLQRLGYRVLDAGNGSEALQIWTRQRDAIHLLITDVVMPGGFGGLELADRVLAEKPDLRVILISGYSLEMAKRGLLKSKSIRFLQKPFEAGALARLVRECLDSR